MVPRNDWMFEIRMGVTDKGVDSGRRFLELESVVTQSDRVTSQTTCAVVQ